MKCTSVPRRSVGPMTASGATAHAVAEFHLVDLAVAPDPQLEPVGQRIDDRHADAVQPAGNLVAVLVELAAGVQLGHHDLGRRALQFVVVLDVGRNAAAIVDDRDRVVGVDDDLDVVAVAGERLVDRVVEHLEHHVMQAGAVGRVADVHARTLAHRIEALQDLDAGSSRSRRRAGRGFGLCLGHRGFRFKLPNPVAPRARAPILVPLDAEVGVVPALHQHAGAADRQRLGDLLEDHALRRV